MKIDRNINADGRGKYALLKLRELDHIRGGQMLCDHQNIKDALALLESYGILDWGAQRTEDEFFVIRLKDKYAASALKSYAVVADFDGQHEYAAEVFALSQRAGHASPWCKKPD